MKNFSLTLLLLCCASFAFAQNYQIDFNVTGFKDQTKFYLEDVANQDIIDSAVIVGNKFTMTGKAKNIPTNLWIHANYQNNYYYTVLFIADDHVKVSGDISQMPFALKITGAKEQDLFNSLYSRIGIDYKKRDTLMKQVFALNGDTAKVNPEKRKILAVVRHLDSSDDSLRIAFIHQHLNSYFALSELDYLKGQYNRDTLQKMYNSLLPQYRDSHYGKVVATYLKVGDPLKTGDPFTDFAGQDRNGNLHKLSEIKNKYILLDFSATWCGPCMKSVQEIKDLIGQYPDKLSVVTFSEDAGKSTWIEGLNRDKSEWLSLWDGKGIDSETSLKYGVTGFPTFFLIDPHGKIVASQVGYDTGVLKQMLQSAKIDANPL